MVAGSSPAAATAEANRSTNDKGIVASLQSCSPTAIDKGISYFLLDCRVRGLSEGTLNCYSTKLKDFHRFIGGRCIEDISTEDIREYLATLRDRGCNSTTLQRHYRVLHNFWNWLIDEEIATVSPLDKIKCPREERKRIEALTPSQINEILATFDNSFTGKRNKAIFLVLVDCGLRLGELLHLTTENVDMKHQLLKVKGKTGERVVRFGNTTAKALLKWLMARDKVATDSHLWLSSQGQPLGSYAIEDIFRRLPLDFHIHPHLCRHTMATSWLKNGGDSLLLQRFGGWNTLQMVNRYTQAVGSYDALEAHKRYSPIDNLK